MSNIDKVEVGGTEYGIEGVAADSKDDTVTFTSSDVADGSATSWTTVTKVSSGEKHSSLFAKMSQMFKNVRYLYKLLGTTDVSSFFGGSGQDITGALATLNTNIGSHTVAKNVPSNAVFTDHTYSALPDVYVNTDGGTAAKVGISPNFVLRDQARFTVRIANTNTYEGTLTLNINDTGAKEITIMGASTADELPAGDYSVFYSLSANTYYFFLYDQLGFHTVAKDVPYDAIFTDTTYSGLPDVYVSTAAGTQTKVGTSPNYVLRSGSRFTVRIKNANSYNGVIKLNINSTGAKNVYINGAVSSSSNKTLPAGDYSVYYDGSYYYFNTSDEITSLNSALTNFYYTVTNSSSSTIDKGNYITVRCAMPASGKYEFVSVRDWKTNDWTVILQKVEPKFNESGLFAVDFNFYKMESGSATITCEATVLVCKKGHFLT